MLSDDDKEELNDSSPRHTINQQMSNSDNSLRVWQYKATWEQVPQAEQQQ